MKNTVYRKEVISILVLSSTLLAVSPGICQAVDPSQLPDAGKSLSNMQHPRLELPKQENSKVEIEQPVPFSAQEGNSVRIHVRGYKVIGQDIFPDGMLEDLLSDSKDQDLTIAQLEARAERITNFFREQGYMVAKAYLPAQKINDGMVQIAVVVGKYDKIVLTNKTRIKDRVLRRELSVLQSGDYIEKKSLERAVWLLSDLAGANAKVTLSRGSKPGTSDLLVNVEPGIEKKGSLSMDNYGNRYTGSTEFSLAYDLDNPSRQGDSLALNLNTTTDNLLTSGSLSYQLPAFKPGQKVGFSYSDVHYQLGDEYKSADSTGTAKVAKLSWSANIIRSSTHNLSGQVSCEQGKLADYIKGSPTNEKTNHALTFGLNGDSQDAKGATSYAVSYRIGKLSIDNLPERQSDDVTAHSDGWYQKYNLNVLRQQSLTPRAYLLLSLSGQLASKNLDSSEKMSLGGASAVRAYPQGEASGDEGYLATAELRWTMPLPKHPDQSFQLAAFFDNGSVRSNKNPWTNENNRRTLSGAGLGVIWSRGNDLSVHVNYAWELGSEAATSDHDKSGRLWIQAVKRF